MNRGAEGTGGQDLPHWLPCVATHALNELGVQGFTPVLSRTCSGTTQPEIQPRLEPAHLPRGGLRKRRTAGKPRRLQWPSTGGQLLTRPAPTQGFCKTGSEGDRASPARQRVSVSVLFFFLNILGQVSEKNPAAGRTLSAGLGYNAGDCNAVGETPYSIASASCAGVESQPEGRCTKKSLGTIRHN